MTVPAIYVVGDRDLVVRFPGADKLIPNLRQFVPQLRETIMLPGCGHWTQQERPEEINAALVRFLKELKLTRLHFLYHAMRSRKDKQLMSVGY